MSNASAAIKCPRSGTAPDDRTFHERRGGRVICPACGQRVQVFVRRLDWSAAHHTYMADHEQNGSEGPVQ